MRAVFLFWIRCSALHIDARTWGWKKLEFRFLSQNKKLLLLLWFVLLNYISERNLKVEIKLNSNLIKDTDICIDIKKVGQEFCAPNKSSTNCVRPCYALHFVLFGRGTLVDTARVIVATQFYGYSKWIGIISAIKVITDRSLFGFVCSQFQFLPAIGAE